MLILTGQRLRQVAGMRWEEIDRLESPNPLWRVPGDRMKGKREHELPISLAAAELLSSIKKLAISEEYVFAIRSPDGETMHMNWFSKPKARLDRLSGVAFWRLHDLRRTVATNLEHMGIERITISTILAHRIPGVTEIYTRADRRERMRIALENWSVRVGELTGEGQNASNVITMAAQQ
jgi:integrase